MFRLGGPPAQGARHDTKGSVTSMGIELSRRSFVGMAAAGAAAGVAAAGAGAALASEAAPSAGEAQAGQAAQASPAQASPAQAAQASPAQSLSADIVIVGAGMSGLAAAVEAGDLGLDAIVLEASEAAGGNGSEVEGILGVDSSLQREQGLTIEPASVIKSELGWTHARQNGLLWMDLIHKAGANVDWLIDHGVKFTGQVDAYFANGEFPTFHWFEGGFAKVGYIPYMQQSAEDAGVRFMFSTRARSLTTQDGAVTGVTAEDADGNLVQISAKAVVLATGGFGGNLDLLATKGYDRDALFSFGAPYHDGDGYLMAMEAGAGSTIQNFCALENLSVEGINDIASLFHEHNAIITNIISPTNLWVNENGERFVYEDCGVANFHAMMTPSTTQKRTYCVFDAGVYAENVKANLQGKTAEESQADLDDYLAEREGVSIVQAGTVEELAEKAAEAFGVDAGTLQASVERYNELCAAGEDADFGKDAAYMVELANPPYYMAHLTQGVAVAIGGVHTDRHMRVLTAEGEPVPGLYCCGVDGAELYRNQYTINIGGSCNANNVNSGRTAVETAAEERLGE